MIYELEFKKSVEKDIKRLPQAVLTLLKKRILELGNNPYPQGVKNLRGYPGCYRVRVGNYRILYMISSKKKIIAIIKISHRKDVYGGL